MEHLQSDNSEAVDQVQQDDSHHIPLMCFTSRVFTFRALQCQAAVYIADLITQVTYCSLSEQGLLFVPHAQLNTTGDGGSDTVEHSPCRLTFCSL